VAVELTNHSDGPVRLTRRLGGVTGEAAGASVVQLALERDRIEFRHRCTDAGGNPCPGVETGRFVLPGDIGDETTIGKGQSARYYLIYKFPQAPGQGVQYVVSTHYQGEVAGKLRTTIPWPHDQENRTR